LKEEQLQEQLLAERMMVFHWFEVRLVVVLVLVLQLVDHSMQLVAIF